MRLLLQRVLLLMAAGAILHSGQTARGQRPSARLKESKPQSGSALQRALLDPISASFVNRELRPLLANFAEERRLTLLLDRRIDPNQNVTLQFANEPAETGLSRLSGEVGGELKQVGNVLYIAPPAAAAKLRTLVALRAQELAAPALRLPAARRAELSAPLRLHWQDLDRPREIVEQLAARFELAISGLDRIPHDLWGGATLNEVSLVEGLSLVLIQFDLTFAWNEAAGIEIVPVPETVVLERSYTPRGMRPAEASRKWPEEIPDLETTVKGGKVSVWGTLEQHEALELLLDPKQGVRKTEPKAAAPVPLSKRSFTGRFKISARLLLEELKKSGIQFDYDATKLAAKGIDLDKVIEFEVTKATAEEFFRKFFDPLGIKFAIDGVTVTLTPK